MDLNVIIYRILVSAIPVFMGIILHELAHAFAAYKMGDETAKNQGRLTLNPIAHIDKTGLLVYIMTTLMGPFVFGWAKPVPVNPRNFTKINDVKTGMMLVSIAGPMANFFLAILFAIALKLYIPIVEQSPSNDLMVQFVLDIISNGISLNLVLMVLNLLPIPPLDGSHILAKILPYPLDYKFMEFRKYGTILLIILLATGILSHVMQFFLNLMYPLMVMIIQ